MSDPSGDSIFSGITQHDLPVIGLTLVVILCIYLAVGAFKEYSTENRLKSAMYDETGITSTYEYELPEEEKVCNPACRAFHALLFSRLSFIKQRRT